METGPDSQKPIASCQIDRRIEQKGVHFKSIQESLFDTTSPHGRFVFNIFASVAQLERDIIIERTPRRTGKFTA
ncbi:recombinase family protein [Winogradskyella maritima]|nr:recombinase family protein [Winogradskyella maritima]